MKTKEDKTLARTLSSEELAAISGGANNPSQDRTRLYADALTGFTAKPAASRLTNLEGFIRKPDLKLRDLLEKLA